MVMNAPPPMTPGLTPNPQDMALAQQFAGGGPMAGAGMGGGINPGAGMGGMGTNPQGAPGGQSRMPAMMRRLAVKAKPSSAGKVRVTRPGAASTKPRVQVARNAMRVPAAPTNRNPRARIPRRPTGVGRTVSNSFPRSGQGLSDTAGNITV